ncbi:hypothetical protein E2C01_024556 [Portunus trituberculatus]|uniref:Uncharacterized protein n=1 Tax=Portunus trituberculatus TaxID=210409 RepID=A0A5B7EAY7_PORTR|nr:hypothetical protein [Portunus trituberculatus]
MITLWRQFLRCFFLTSSRLRYYAKQKGQVSVTPHRCEEGWRRRWWWWACLYLEPLRRRCMTRLDQEEE